MCALYRSVCRGGEAEESHPGGGVFGSCCGPHTAGSRHVHCVCDGYGGIPQGQQDSSAHGDCCLSGHMCVRSVKTFYHVTFGYFCVLWLKVDFLCSSCVCCVFCWLSRLLPSSLPWSLKRRWDVKKHWEQRHCWVVWSVVNEFNFSLSLDNQIVSEQYTRRNQALLWWPGLQKHIGLRAREGCLPIVLLESKWIIHPR